MSEHSFYTDPEFSVLVAFVGFILLFGPLIYRMVGKALDTRSAQVAEELAQAKRLREEAQAVLASYQKKQQESLQEAEAILNGAKKLAMDKIAQAETKALQDVQSHVVDIAVSVARTVIAAHVERSGNDEAVKLAAAELEQKLH